MIAIITIIDMMTGSITSTITIALIRRPAGPWPSS